MTNYDLIIIGAGPAGLTAGMYAARYRLNVLVIGQLPGGLMTESHKICNWPGDLEVVGAQLSLKMKEATEKNGAKIMLAEVAGIVKHDQGYEVSLTGKEEKVSANFLLFATGTKHRKLELANEEKFLGRGLSYCATCDALFFRDRVVGVIGSGNSAITSALYLADVASKVVMIIRGEALKGEPAWIEELKKKTNVEIVYNTKVTELIGEEKLSGVKFDQELNGASELTLDGLFVEIGLDPKTELFASLGGKLTEKNFIEVGKDQLTGLERVYAAGDVTTGSNNFHQIITACAEGAVAANAIFMASKG